MSRPKRVIKIPEYIVSEIQEYLNLEETIKEINKRFYEAESEAYIEAQENCIYTIFHFLVKELNLNGKPDMNAIKEEYKYYSKKKRTPHSSINCVILEANKDIESECEE